MDEMYVWTVKLEGQYKSEWIENGKKKSGLWENNEVEYTVAAKTGREAISKAESLFMSQVSWEGEHYLDSGEDVPSKEYPHKVLDVIYLELVQTLDG